MCIFPRAREKQNIYRMKTIGVSERVRVSEYVWNFLLKINPGISYTSLFFSEFLQLIELCLLSVLMFSFLLSVSPFYHLPLPFLPYPTGILIHT